ncbi:MAG: phosphoribosylanthranilate isomerase [Armatimonadota bacterium]
MVRVKICGITNTEDALAAAEAGVDFLGFIFAESPRKVDAETAASIIKELPPYITTVGVFAGLDAEAIVEIIKKTGLDCAQVYDHAACNMAPVAKEVGCRRVIRVFNIKNDDDIEKMKADAVKCDCGGFLMDAYVDGQAGGTGRTFDWDLAARAMSCGKSIILAGGLTPDNVAEAVARVNPRVVDVSSGVEASPGKKDHDKIREFIRNAKQPV